MFECRLAYRFGNGDIEGFTGCGSTKESAERNCIAQMRRKISTIVSLVCPDVIFTEANVIRSSSGLTKAQQAQIKKDWGSTVRY